MGKETIKKVPTLLLDKGDDTQQKNWISPIISTDEVIVEPYDLGETLSEHMNVSVNSPEIINFTNITTVNHSPVDYLSESSISGNEFIPLPINANPNKNTGFVFGRTSGLAVYMDITDIKIYNVMKDCFKNKTVKTPNVLDSENNETCYTVEIALLDGTYYGYNSIPSFASLYNRQNNMFLIKPYYTFINVNHPDNSYNSSQEMLYATNMYDFKNNDGIVLVGIFGGGIDLGIFTMAAFQDGTNYCNIKYLPKTTDLNKSLIQSYHNIKKATINKAVNDRLYIRKFTSTTEVSVLYANGCTLFFMDINLVTGECNVTDKVDIPSLINPDDISLSRIVPMGQAEDGSLTFIFSKVNSDNVKVYYIEKKNVTEIKLITETDIGSNSFFSPSSERYAKPFILNVDDYKGITRVFLELQASQYSRFILPVADFETNSSKITTFVKTITESNVTIDPRMKASFFNNIFSRNGGFGNLNLFTCADEYIYLTHFNERYIDISSNYMRLKINKLILRLSTNINNFTDRESVIITHIYHPTQYEYYVYLWINTKSNVVPSLVTIRYTTDISSSFLNSFNDKISFPFIINGIKPLYTKNWVNLGIIPSIDRENPVWGLPIDIPILIPDSEVTVNLDEESKEYASSYKICENTIETTGKIWILSTKQDINNSSKALSGTIDIKVPKIFNGIEYTTRIVDNPDKHTSGENLFIPRETTTAKGKYTLSLGTPDTGINYFNKSLEFYAGGEKLSVMDKDGFYMFKDLIVGNLSSPNSAIPLVLKGRDVKITDPATNTDISLKKLYDDSKLAKQKIVDALIAKGKPSAITDSWDVLAQKIRQI